MLRVRQLKHLLRALDASDHDAELVSKSADSFYEELLLHNPQRPDKLRVVVNVNGLMRTLQRRLYRRILLPKLKPSVYSHGCVTGRSIKSNAAPHVGSAHAFKTDISDFYPSVHSSRVYRLFHRDFECSPDVARLCTRICTYRYHLALGLITSPILADSVLNRVDRRIGGACQKAGLKYTRFVDDVTISGPFDLERSGFAALVERILNEDGFTANPAKHRFGSLSSGLAITSLRENRGHLDVTQEYIAELIRQIEDAKCLARGAKFCGPYYTSEQILGRVRFVCWVNPGRRRELMKRFRSVNWTAVRANARKLGLEASRKTLSKIVDSEKAQKNPGVAQACSSVSSLIPTTKDVSQGEQSR